ncbi:HEAT repeat domain-containing protein, partial [Singulisphaera rosea]
ADLPPGVVGKAEKPSGVLLRFDRDSRLWVQLNAETPLKDQDRILNLQPFRSTLSFGEAKVDLVGETEVWVLPPLPGQAARLHLAQGRIVLHGTPNASPFSIQFAKKFVNLVPPSGSHVGLERLNRREPGAPTASNPVLKVSASEGSVPVSVDEAKETVVGPGSITFESPGSWIEADSKPVPTWVVDAKPSTYDLQVGEQFQKFFRDRPIIPTLVEAMDVDQNDVRRLAIFALRAVGDISYVVPLLNRKEDPVTRRASIAVLRDFLAQAPDSAATLHAQILDYFGEDQAATVEKLIVGYSAKEAGDEGTFSELIQLLSSPDVGIRELALDNLQGLTGRDDLKYSPEHPEGAGLRAWKDLLRDHELRPAGKSKSAPKADALEETPKDEK